jgi:hypothetical protein
VVLTHTLLLLVSGKQLLFAAHDTMLPTVVGGDLWS